MNEMKKTIIISLLMLAAVVSPAQTCPDSNHPHAIDLGLPSGTKWACCNMGASSPEDYGSLFAFGEMEEKEIYDYRTYSLRNVRFQYETIVDRSDVAYVKWGQEWHIPSPDQFNELKDNCTSEWKVVKGVNGRVFKGKNGNSVFLPAVGKAIAINNESKNKLGNYWTNREHWESDKAFYFFFSNSSTGQFDGLKFLGLSIRPIKRK